jgi:general secretion pathway protein K
MNRRGFALLAILWLVVILTGVTAVSLAATHRAVWTARNRVWLRRAEWARDACLAILRVRYARHYSLTASDSGLSPLPRIDLGRGSWCRVDVDHPERRLNLNAADPSSLRLLLRRDDLTDALLDWRDVDDLPRALGAETAWYSAERRSLPRNGPLASVDELLLVRGFDSALVDRLRPLITTAGTGRVDIATAPPEVLALLPGLGPEAIDALVRRRPVHALEDLADNLSRAALEEFLGNLEALRRLTSIGVSQYTAEALGGIDGTPILASARIVLVPTASRLAVVRVEAS